MIRPSISAWNDHNFFHSSPLACACKPIFKSGARVATPIVVA